MWKVVKAILTLVLGLGALTCVGFLAGDKLGEIAGNLLAKSTDE